MCGIAGIYHYGEPGMEPPRPLLERMGELLRHRGPDDSGVYIDGTLGFVHRRLSILDVSPTGHQPMVSASGERVICYNGELYNHIALKETLGSLTPRWRGRADTEILLEYLERFGTKGLPELIGIFSFAYWNRQDKELWLARDPMGVKQVYYWDDGRKLVFASEIKGILCHPEVRAEVNPDALSEYMHFHTPIRANTFFKDIHLLEAGHFLRVTRHGVTRERYAPRPDYSPYPFRREEMVERLQTLMREVIGSQLMSDVPVGCFLSGGIDSSMVARFSTELFGGNVKDGFGCFYENQGVQDESGFAREVANAFSIKLHECTVTSTEFPAILEDALYHQDEPKIGEGMISMYAVSRLAARHVKVSLGGQGADELFGGYARYAAVSPFRQVFWELWRRYEDRETGIGSTAHKQLGKEGNFKRFVALISRLTSWQRRYFGIISQVPEEMLTGALPAFAGHLGKDRMFRRFLDIIEQCPSSDPMDKVMFWDQQTYLQGLFAQDDRMSMAHSLESRVPLADQRMSRFAGKTRVVWKMRGFSTKWLLKKSLSDVLPTSVINRRKGGFETPGRLWLTVSNREYVREMLLGDTARRRGIYNSEYIEKLLDNELSHGALQLVWKLLNIEVWARLHLDDKNGVYARTRK